VRTPFVFLTSLILAGVAHAAPPPLASAEALVRAQYAPDADASSEMMARLYAPEVAAAFARALAGGGDIGFDPRYGDSDWKTEGLSVSAEPAPGGVRVKARFSNFGKATEVDWRLVPAADGVQGWRVTDISAPVQNDLPAWDLRELLGLPAGGDGASAKPRKGGASQEVGRP
jgi:hypothetical protein